MFGVAEDSGGGGGGRLGARSKPPAMDKDEVRLRCRLLGLVFWFGRMCCSCDDEDL